MGLVMKKRGYGWVFTNHNGYSIGGGVWFDWTLVRRMYLLLAFESSRMHILVQ